MDGKLFRWREIEKDVYQVTNLLDERAYVARGTESALVVDTCSGVGDLFAVVREIVGNLPYEVALTHSHYDHVGGSFGERRVFMSEAEDHKWEDETSRGLEAFDKLLAAGTIPEGVTLAARQGSVPEVVHIEEGDTFDLGGLTVEVVALPGHTAGHLGYLVRERRVLLSGDAATPIMCLWFADALPISGYRETLKKMQGLACDRFFTGHHEEGFDLSVLESFDATAAFAETARGIPWVHSLLEEYRGTIYLAPCDTTDVDSPDFRALIGPYVPRERKGRRRRAKAQQGS